MSEADARFADGRERPLRLRALDAEDLTILSALVQDAVMPASEMAYVRRQRRFAALLNRFRWEGATRTPERVRSMLVVEGVTAVRSQGVDPKDRDTVLSLLQLSWEPGEEGAGLLLLTLAVDGTIAVEVEALEVVLRDVTKPYLAPSRKAPSHPE